MKAWVLFASALAAVAAVPTPESHFGHKMGVDRKLISWPKVVSYFQALEKSSDRIKVRTLGKTTEGRDFIAAWISSPAAIRDLDRYRDIQARLADPRRTTEAEAVRLSAQGKVVVMITCSIHSSEVASTLTAVEFAHRILTEERPKFKAILDNVIFILVPSLNPDGVDIVTDWYRQTLGTPYEGSLPPRLYQKYVGHDNNRDWYIFSQRETRLTVSQLHNVWHPQIVYDVHQQGSTASRMFVPPWLDPIEPNVDPVIAQAQNMIGAGMAADLTAAGKKGISINASYDFWTPARHYQAFHGGLRILSESASANLASPVTIRPEEIRETAPGYNPRERSWNHLEPWMGGAWGLRDIIDYQLIAWESCLWQAAVRREDFLRNFYGIHQRAVARTSPSAFVIPALQRDPGAVRQLLETLAFGQVEIERSTATDDYVIRLQQPYGNYAKALLERQQYPDLRLYPGGPPKQPYDVTAHTLPLLFGVNVKTVETPVPQNLTRVTTFDDLPKPQPQRLAELKKRRIGLYKSFLPSMDEGWTRWILEQMEIPYLSVENPEIVAGKLKAKYDVILFPDQGPGTINNGYRPGSMPSQYTGGLGDRGAQALIEFARQGGTLIFLNDSTLYAVGHLGLPLKNVVRGVPSRDFYCPGSLLNVSLDPAHPLSQGLPPNIAIWFESGPAWEVTDSTPAKSVARYPASGILASGWLLGEKYLANQSALLDVPLGKGRAILFGMRPQYRAQSYLTMKLLWNALLL